MYIYTYMYVYTYIYTHKSTSLFSATLTDGSAEGVSGIGSDFSVSGTSAGLSSTDSFFESLGSTVGSDFFFLNFAN